MNFLSSASPTVQMFVGSDLVDLAARVNAALNAYAATVYVEDISLGGAGHGNQFFVCLRACSSADFEVTKDETAANFYAFKANDMTIYLDSGANETELRRAMVRATAWMTATGSSGDFVATEIAGSSKGQVFGILGVVATRTTVSKG